LNQIICKTHEVGPFNEGSQMKHEHESMYDNCKWEDYDINKDCSAIDEAEIKQANQTENNSISEKLYAFASSKIKKKVLAQGDSNSVYILIENNGHTESVSLADARTKDWLRYLYYKETGENHSDESYKNALSLIRSEVLMDAVKTEVIHNRIAMTGDAIYYDLANPDWQAVKISKTGVEIVSLNENTPIFARRQHQHAQVLPKFKRAALGELVQLLRIPSKDRQLFMVHLVSMLVEKYPIPIMNILGEQGSNKTTLAKSVKNIVDPSGGNISSIPRNKTELLLHFNNRYLVNFDNVSGFDSETSDIFCRAITGEGQSKRQLYTDQDEVIFNYRRKIVINGIAPTLEFPDYRERSIFYETLPLKDYERLTEEEYNRKFAVLLPYVLGDIFIALHRAMQLYDSVKLELKRLERMADFTIFGECISRALGFPPLTFYETYRERMQFNSIDIRESFPIVSLIDKVMIAESAEKYEDTVSNFYKRITSLAQKEQIDVKSKGVNFPQLPNKVKQHLEKLKPNLRNMGFEVEVYSYNKRDGAYPRGSHLIKITRISKQDVLSDKYQKQSLSPLSDQNHEQNPTLIDRHSGTSLSACNTDDTQKMQEKPLQT